MTGVWRNSQPGMKPRVPTRALPMRPDAAAILLVGPGQVLALGLGAGREQVDRRRLAIEKRIVRTPAPLAATRAGAAQRTRVNVLGKNAR